MQGHSRWGNIHLRTILHVLCPVPSGVSLRNAVPPPLRRVSHWPGAHQLDKTGWPVNLGDPPVSMSQHWGSNMCHHTPFFMWVLELKSSGFTDYLLRPSKYLFNDRETSNCWQLAFRDAPALESVSFPCSANSMCPGWGNTCAEKCGARSHMSKSRVCLSLPF